jgi:biotin operon repressor
MRKVNLAFIDETGNYGFDFEKQGVASHFIMTSILVGEQNKNLLETGIEVIAQELFSGGEIKSKNIRRRKLESKKKVYKALQKLDFHIYSIVVDKNKLYSEGFKYKPSFYKFLYGLLYQELDKSFPVLRIQNDEHGSKEFMEGFVKYVKENHMTDLFGNSDFTFEKSNNARIIQLADAIGGLLGEKFDSSVKSNDGYLLFELFEDQIIDIEHWPEEFDYEPFIESPKDDFYEEMIATLSLNLAESFISRFEEKFKSDQKIQNQINCIKYLKTIFRFNDPNKYISGDEIRNHLNSLRHEEMSEHYFYSNVIAKLRDEGVLIVSGNNGYKLPCAKNDLYQFVNKIDSMVGPLLHRLQISRNRILRSSKNELDILDRPEFIKLKDILDNKSFT